MHDSHSQKGFTLLELLIALAIFSLMSAMAYGGLTAVLKTRESVGQSMDKLTEIQKAIYRLQSDIESSQARPIRNQYGDVEAAMRLELDGLGLYLTRTGWRNPLSMPRSALQRVYYRLEEKQLIRRSWPTLDGIAVDSPVEEEYQEVVLLDDVEDIEWRFLQNPPVQGASFDDLEWIEQWPPFSLEKDNQALPLAVELLLTTKDWGEIRYLYRINQGMKLTALTPSADGGGDANAGNDSPSDEENNNEDNNNGEDNESPADTDNPSAEPADSENASEGGQ